MKSRWGVGAERARQGQVPIFFRGPQGGAGSFPGHAAKSFVRPWARPEPESPPRDFNDAAVKVGGRLDKGGFLELGAGVLYPGKRSHIPKCHCCWWVPIDIVGPKSPVAPPGTLGPNNCVHDDFRYLVVVSIGDRHERGGPRKPARHTRV